MEGAYNSGMYKGKCKKKEHQEDYCTPVYDEWCMNKESKGEHQKAAAPIALGGETQSSAKPSQW